MASPSLFCVRWMRKTIRNVTIVVPVLITSCHVLEKPNRGPLAAQSTTTATASIKPLPLPTKSVTRVAATSAIFPRFREGFVTLSAFCFVIVRLHVDVIRSKSWPDYLRQGYDGPP